jgi:putative PEP-CTERM system histidine kinase
MTGILYDGCVASYVAVAAFVLLRTRSNPSRAPLLAACLLTVLWAGFAAAKPAPNPLGGVPGLLDLLRLAGWYGFALHVYHRFVPGGGAGPGRTFTVMGVLIALMVGGAMLIGGFRIGGAVSLLSAAIAARLVLAICQLLLLENLFRNAAEDSRWNINLICIALGAPSMYDIVLCTDAALFRQVSPVLADGRTLTTILVAPLLALAAVRSQGWKPPELQFSRAAVFHSASLVLSGALLLALAGVGEVFRAFGTRWGAVAEVGLLCGGVIAVAVLLTSGSGRSHIRAALVDPFFAERYDYRIEWMRCIDTLSGVGGGAPLHTRVICTIAQVVDSPAGVLFLREDGPVPAGGAFAWAGSWNMPAVAQPVPADHPLLRGFAGGEEIVVPDPVLLAALPTDTLPAVWLAVPLPHGGALAGFVLLAPPRGPFALDREVFALLRTVGREVATYLAEQRAMQALLEARQLRDFGKRFAFVAHDIKNVSSQLSLLLANAEHHIDNPEFQRDMLHTVRASVQKISVLLRRLQEPQSGMAGGAGEAMTGGLAEPRLARVEPLARLEAIAETCQRLRRTTVALEHDTLSGEVAIEPAAFDAVVTHLLDNAVEAAGSAAPLRILLRHEQRQVLIDIIDQGPGMTPEFIRDELFRPFRTSKREGSGIGAFQARELLREAGGDLIVLSRPGAGTTMRLLLPLAEGAALPAAAGMRNPG